MKTVQLGIQQPSYTQRAVRGPLGPLGRDTEVVAEGRCSGRLVQWEAGGHVAWQGLAGSGQVVTQMKRAGCVLPRRRERVCGGLQEQQRASSGCFQKPP